MSSLFKKPKKNLRQRITTSDDDGEAESEVPNAQPPLATSSASNKPPKPPKSSSIKATPEVSKAKKVTSTLSFQEDLEEDEGVETFQIKKSSQSRRIARKMQMDRKLKQEEQKMGKNEVPSSRKTVDEQPKEEEEELPAPPENLPKNLILSGREAEMAGYRSDSDEESDNEGIKFRQPDPFRNVLESGNIPDAAMIFAARKQRQQARELGGLADYIKLDEMPDYEKEDGKVTSARLVREDDHDKSDEEEGEDGRVDFSVDLQSKDRERRKEAFLAAEREDDREASEDEDEDDWERQQFQKAIGQRQVESAHQEMILQQQYVEGSPSSSTRSPARDTKAIKGPSGPLLRQAIKGAGSSSSSSVPPDLSKLEPLASPLELQEKLRAKLEGLQEVHRRHVSDLERSQSHLVSCKEEIERIESDRPRLSERFKFFQITRGYVQDLIDCLTTKYYEVEAVEKRWVALLGRRNKYLLERRREDVRDEASDCAIQSVIVQSINPDKLARTAEREARRRRRRNGRKESARHKEGLSSDDEELGDKEDTNFTIEKIKILEETGQVFADTMEEFYSLETICNRFEDWRKQEKDSYRDAYVEMFIPRLACTVVRWHLLRITWNPLEHEVTTLNKSAWFQTLAQYDLRSENENSGGSKDSINPLVISKTLEIAVLPYVVEVVKASYDPCSTSQTNRLVKLVKTVKDEHPSLSGSSNKVIQSILTAAVEKFEAAVDQDVFIPFHFAAQNPGFVNRQFWSAAKLLRNILHWQGVIEDAQIRSVGLDKLFKKYMLLPLTKTTVRGGAADPDTLDKVRYIAEALPKNWLGPLAPGASQLQPLVDTAMSLAQYADSTTSAGRKHVKNVAAVLQTLGASAEAQEILVKYL